MVRTGQLANTTLKKQKTNSFIIVQSWSPSSQQETPTKHSPVWIVEREAYDKYMHSNGWQACHFNVQYFPILNLGITGFISSLSNKAQQLQVVPKITRIKNGEGKSVPIDWEKGQISVYIFIFESTFEMQAQMAALLGIQRIAEKTVSLRP